MLLHSNTSQGAGFIFDKEGWILTSNHVVANNNRVSVLLSDGVQLLGTVVGVDE